MDATATPGFEEWVDFCFAHGYRSPSEAVQDAAAVVLGGHTRYLALAPSLVAEYLTRLFDSPGFIAERYSDAQIANATWFMFGSGSSGIGGVRRAQMNKEQQARCIRAVATMYTELFDRVCGNHGREPDKELYDSTPIDIAVYMIWDMDQLQYIPIFPEKTPHLVEPALYVLDTVLKRCGTSSCLISALHGIGHVIQARDSAGDTAMVARLQQMIDDLRARRPLPDWLTAYAVNARDGFVL